MQQRLLEKISEIKKEELNKLVRLPIPLQYLYAANTKCKHTSGIRKNKNRKREEKRKEKGGDKEGYRR